MESNLEELRFKEVISVTDGSRFGYVGDLNIDLDTGRILSLVVPGQRRYFFGLLGSREIRLVPWGQVKRFGPDVILVEGEPVSRERSRRRSWDRTTGK
ncbi:MAG: YlmC/YmxH family sporulation protein [Clostridiales bacterium]|nr:YlmC/YmxH family sporulation protein [Clostridiales bacterium]